MNVLSWVGLVLNGFPRSPTWWLSISSHWSPQAVREFRNCGDSRTHYHLREGSPIPGSQTSTGPWPVRNQAAQQEVSNPSFICNTAAPITHVTTAWAQPPVRSAVALDSRRSSNPTVSCTCEGSRLHTPHENLIPDGLRWSWGRDASAG